MAGAIFISHLLLGRVSAVFSFQSGPSPYTGTLALRPSVFSRVQVSFKNSLIAGEGSLDNPDRIFKITVNENGVFNESGDSRDIRP